MKVDPYYPGQKSVQNRIKTLMKETKFKSTRKYFKIQAEEITF
jgi:hypothetical protein